MPTISCPTCSNELPAHAAACPQCGTQLNGAPCLDKGAADGTANAPMPGVAELSPELLALLRAEFNAEEFRAGLANVQETGGLELKDFIHELEQEAQPRE